MSNITSDQLSRMNFRPNSVTIASVYPIERVQERDYAPNPNGGRTKFVLPSAPRDSFTTLTVYDSWQVTKDILNNNRDVPLPVYANEIAVDLITHWVNNCFGSSIDNGPGIMIIAGETPTDTELEFMRGSQRRMAERMVHDGDHAAEKNEWKRITDVHRALARWVDYKAVWVADLNADTKQCKVCFSPVNIKSRICKECKMDPDRSYEQQTATPAVATPAAAPIEPPSQKPKIAPPVKLPTAAMATA